MTRTDPKRMADCRRAFDKRVDVRGEDECWPWTGHLNPKGYGILTTYTDGKAQKHKAHRVSFEIENGYLPEVVRHRCDNPPCCNPRHLQGGSHVDNVIDRDNRGRTAKGSCHGRAVLTEEDVREMRRERLSARAAATKYGVTYSVAYRAMQGTTWRHVR